MKLGSVAQGMYCLCVLFWFLLLLNATARPAYAYVDPGAGLLMLQMLGSTLAGAMFLVRKRIRQLLGRISRRFAEADGDIAQR